LAQPSIRRNDGPLALVLAPTRELAQQIEKEVIYVFVFVVDEKWVILGEIYCLFLQSSNDFSTIS